MTNITFVRQQSSLETDLAAALTAQGRPKLPAWFIFPEAAPGDETLFPVSDKTAHLFVLYCKYALGHFFNSLGQCPKPDEQETRIVADIWELHLRSILEHYLRKKIINQELSRYEIRTGWKLVKTNLPADTSEDVRC